MKKIAILEAEFDTENNEYYCASFKLLQAINKQCEELGWLKDE